MIAIKGKRIIPIVNQRGSIIGENGIDIDRDLDAVLYLPGYPYSGATIYDRSGASPANDGTIDGATWVRESSGLWVLDFDGTDDVVTATRIDAVTYTGTYTFEFWFNITAAPSTHTIIQNSLGELDRNGVGLDLLGSNICLSYRDADNVLHSKSGAYTLGVWTHFLGTNNAGTLALKLNDVTQTGTEDATIRGASATLWIGNSSDGTQDFNGKLALIRIYDSVVAGHFNQEKHLFGV